MGRLKPIAVLGLQRVERHDQAATTPLEGPVVIAAIGKVVNAGGHEKRSESALGTVDRGQAVFLEQGDEEALDQILSRFGIVPPAADKCIERIPVDRAEFGKRSRRLGCIPVACGRDPTPMGRRKLGIQSLGRSSI